eukprot:Phypoly_transcript_01805.p1 GENE.Phypoly_transcript_01805~~Phypoly_transcript_01805.p1  ORF type:complete len:826 (+),score=108.69 Phypoly_transcript_01805:123-2480(+)
MNLVAPPRTTTSFLPLTGKASIEDAVTIVIKTFERPLCVTRLVASIRERFKRIKIHIADDSHQMLLSDVSSILDENVFYHKIDEDSGLAAGRNFLVNQVLTDYVLVLDDDFVFTSETDLDTPLRVLMYTDRTLVGGCVSAGSLSYDIYKDNTELHVKPDLKCAADISEYPDRIVRPVYGGLTVGQTHNFNHCFETTAVDNFFMANRKALGFVQWDGFLKMGEHEDFFLRAKGILKVGICMNLRVLNDPLSCTPQTENGGYKSKRSRVFSYWTEMFRKHGLSDMYTLAGHYQMQCNDTDADGGTHLMTPDKSFANCRVKILEQKFPLWWGNEIETPSEFFALDKIHSMVYQKKVKIAVLVMATGKYLVYVRELVESGRRYFLQHHEVTFYVFTDGKFIAPDVVVIPQEQLGWPYDTMNRLKIYYENRNAYASADFVYTCDSDALFVGPIGDEILSEMVGTYTSWFFQRPRTTYTYDANPMSTAYISNWEGTGYFAGGFFGGYNAEFVQLCKEVASNIDRDLAMDPPYIALWHDESHLNKYFLLHPPTKRLTPDYMYPEPPVDKSLLQNMPWIWLTHDGGIRYPPKTLNLGTRKEHESMRDDGGVLVVQEKDTKPKPKRCLKAYSCQVNANRGVFCYTVMKWPWLYSYYDAIAICRASGMRLPGWHDLFQGAYHSDFTTCTSCAWTTMSPTPLADKKTSEVKFIARSTLCAGDAPTIKNCSIDEVEGPYCPTCEWYPHKELHGWAAACAKNICNRGYTIDTEDGCKGMITSDDVVQQGYLHNYGGWV